MATRTRAPHSSTATGADLPSRAREPEPAGSSSAGSKRSTTVLQPLLRRGLLAERAGDHAEARHWFQAALDTDPDNITALLWSAWMASTGQESLALLSRVLELDPENKRARAGIRWARRRFSISEASSAKHLPGDRSTSDDMLDVNQVWEEEAPWPSSGSAPPARSELPHETLPLPASPERTGSKTAPRHTRRLIGRLGLLLAITACLFGLGVALIARYSPAAVLAWVLPTATPTMTSTLTVASTPTTAATFTPEPNPTPSATAINTPIPTLTASPVPTLTVLSPTPSTVEPVASPVSPPVAGDEKWIDVDLSQQQVTAYEGSTPIFETTVSTGLPNTPTVIGQFRIYWKLSSTLMVGPGYYLPDVPYTMYFYRGILCMALTGTVASGSR
jgi:hypothetical protein